MSTAGTHWKRTLVLGSALGALFVGNLVLFLAQLWRLGAPDFAALGFFNVAVILPGVLAAAIAAWMFTRDARFTARHRGLQAVGIALLAYVILPLATLAWAFPSLWLAQAMGASATLQPGMASQLPTLAVTWSVIALIATGVPFALVEYVVVRVARKQAAGATAPGAKK